MRDSIVSRKRLAKAIGYLGGYCDKHSSCGECRLYDVEERACKLRQAACDWDPDEMLGQQSEKRED
ncbi:MAG: hypothetical protein J6U56_05395 [Spirochaetia bacterium]|nr:hypothetical protein [Spirochaetia bacterium]